uniref:Ubiquitin thioesterase OTU n=1 Tax=Mesocestoides corti TaxID=53468 RepID=A0A5K3FWL8_MESCO
ERHGINCGQVVQHVCALIRCHTKSGNLGILEPRMTSPVAGSTPSVITSPLNCENKKGDPVVLRCKSLSGQYVLELSSVSTVEELATKVVAYTGIERDALSLRFGFPPKRIDLSPEGAKLTLSELKISSGDCITADGAVSTETPQTQTTSSQALHSRLVRKVAPSDNCCLFTSVNFCVSNRDSSRSIEAPVVTDADEVQETRMLIANIVLSDPATFNEGILGMPVENYIHGIIQAKLCSVFNEGQQTRCLILGHWYKFNRVA